METILESIEKHPIIAAVRHPEDLPSALESPVGNVFLLHADIFNIGELVAGIQAAGKNAFVHLDFLEGIGKDQKAVSYIATSIRPDGLISTRSNIIRFARDLGLFAIQRFFLIDSQSYDTMIQAVRSVRPDMAEVLPGVMPEVIRRARRDLPVPLIAGGLIETKQDIVEVLRAGAHAVSVGKKELWEL